MLQVSIRAPITDDICTDTYAARLKALFWIAVFNFVFPVLVNIAQLVLIYHDPNYVHGAMVQFANNFILVTSVLFATIWCTEKPRAMYGSGRIKTLAVSTIDPNIESNPHFASGDGTTTQIQLSEVSSSTDYSVKHVV